MVKNLPAVERSTKIRFGKHVPDSDVQAENTIVFNASNTLVTTPNSGSIYMSPVRFRPDFSDTNIVLMMYNKATGELSESGESANALVGGSTLQLTTQRGNTTSNVTIFTGANPSNISLMTSNCVGIANLTPEDHTLSVGSNLYVNDTGSDVLVVSGNVSVLRDMTVEGNLTVNGNTTVIYTENTSIKDAFVELGRDNTSGDTTLDLGILMHRPDSLSNVAIGYREGTDEFAIAHDNRIITNSCKLFKLMGDVGNGHPLTLKIVDNAKQYLTLNSVMAVGGSWICPSELIQANQWQAITDLCLTRVAD